MDIDELDIEGMPINALYVRYLMSSFLYYTDQPLLPYTDHQFDSMCRRLLREWESVAHYHKHLCDEEMLRAGTGYSIEFPTIVKGAAVQWSEDFRRLTGQLGEML